MSYEIEIYRRTIDPYSEEGEWMEGDSREVRDHGTDTEAYEPEFDGPEPLPWYSVRRYLGAAERERAWLGGTYEDPYGRWTEETSVHLTGDWTPAERAEIFRAVCSEIPGYRS